MKTTPPPTKCQIPADDKTNGWSAILPDRTAKPAAVKDASFDWLVIGGGYAGLAAARRLATLNPSHSIAVLEAQQAGEGAQGRNAGFAIDLPHNQDHDVESTAKGHRNIRLSRFGIDCLEEVIFEHGISCQWSRRGKLDCAVTQEVSTNVLENTAKELEALGEPFEFLDRDALAARVGTSYYHSGIYTPGTRLMNPAALSRGLADTLPLNVQLFENSPVLEFSHEPIVTATLAGNTRIIARKAVLANNAFVTKFGYFKNRVLPFVLFASLTRPLTQRERNDLGGEQDWGITPAHPIAGATLRYTQDGRILFRYGFSYAPSLRCSTSLRERMKAAHKMLFEKRFPMLPDVNFDHFWAGYIATSHNGSPGWGQLTDNVFAAVICNGVGIAKQTMAGALLAELACDTGHSLIPDMMALGYPNQLPRRPFLDVGVRAYLTLERWRGRAEG